MAAHNNTAMYQLLHSLFLMPSGKTTTKPQWHTVTLTKAHNLKTGPQVTNNVANHHNDFRITEASNLQFMGFWRILFSLVKYNY